MELSGLSIALFVIAISSLTSVIVLWILSLIQSSAKRKVQFQNRAVATSNTFLLNGEQIADHDIMAVPSYLGDIDSLRDWQDLRNWLGIRFEGLPQDLRSISNSEVHFSDGIGEGTALGLTLKNKGKCTWVVLDTQPSIAPAAWHCASHAAYLSSNAKNLLDHVSFPIWKTDRKGDAIWQNLAMARVVNQLGHMPDLHPVSKDSSPLPRFSVPHPDKYQHAWYEVETQTISAQETLHFATGIDKVVQAETAQRDFVQTLTKTFANLTTGLAVFDKNRQLALFNPALVDLTGISVSFLSVRPDVIRFFDELRERQVLPEPKN
jgi:PAS domain-containing protein